MSKKKKTMEKTMMKKRATETMKTMRAKVVLKKEGMTKMDPPYFPRLHRRVRIAVGHR